MGSSHGPEDGSARKYLIINADDFGLSEGVNRGIIRAHERGIVTSASLMVRPPAAAGAAEYARRNPRLGLGLHLDFGEWACREGRWVSVYEVVPPDDAAAAEAEAGRQLAAFRELVGRDPTHIDSHQHAHRHEPLRSVVGGLADALGVPLRHVTPGVGYCGDFYGQTGTGEPVPDSITVPALLAILCRTPTGITELACHPGEDAGLDSPYRAERPAEARTLCSPDVLAAVAREGITLISFADVPDLLRRGSGRRD